MSDMTVKELINQLSKIDPERVVVLACDNEGNSYHPLSSTETARFDEWENKIGFEKQDLEDPNIKELGITEKDIMRGGVPAVVLWPCGKK